MKILLIVFGLLGNFHFIYSQTIIVNHNSVSSQYEDYVTLYHDDIKEILYSYREDMYYSYRDRYDEISTPKIDINELSFKIVPSVSPQVIKKSGDTIFITLIIDYRILPNVIYVFHGQNLYARMDRNRLGYRINYVTTGSPFANHLNCVKNDKKQMIFHLCHLDKNLFVENNEIRFNFGCNNNDRNDENYMKKL